VDRDPLCVLCDPARAQRELLRATVWEDAVWRLSTTLFGAVPGFSYLEPKRHVPHITDLAGAETTTFGRTIARVAAALKAATGAELIYLYVFGGGVPHLHVHLAPHHEGDALSTALVRGELILEPQPNGTTLVRSKDFPPRPHAELRAAADAIREQLQPAR
jgi:diadenosine tetraphosphate (Ap4A) HIT family hydrolase